ncbi:YggS family pyridoxal phosphate-dependent enzyme [Rhodococcus sp. HNM0563]|uniref:YggS family pyridoxal phosphate-dependent enzyme n=1 Tax=unclassified Rhodococcus (in: high G+C Gram-positive bacteria) TaxID=192944 RepID=UPI00146ABCF9|nr:MULTISPECIES: YggS family pyridoxal phosphate-dependent enzyme [unclassified Rhodococcus (in: high G+C Gram-positive bacteria)]MCK0092893.1 YggS family pyridoxal phosphate-dependent enzyme [Rhodococcus sp. F64268]NLU61203.1 YggS family pyridoxal phosphate-dependent enzyme [Rhodococcus sp. HNM0563]
MSDTARQGRRDELARGLDSVRRRLDDAARASGRDPSEVGLLTVTKYFPASDVVLLHELGCRTFGESREQEAHAKIQQFREEVPDPAVQWHMIGRLQRNKARAVARWAHTVHSVDSIRLAGALAAGVAAALDAGERSAPLRVLLQVSLDSDPQRGGVPADGLDALADAVVAADGLELAGLMGVPPLGADADASFEALAQLGVRLRQRYPEARELSAGMSGDLEHAVRHGSTCVRVGTGVLGARPLA